MKRKFAVAAATAALITASLSFSVFAVDYPTYGEDWTVSDPAKATKDYKDDVVVKSDTPETDVFIAKDPANVNKFDPGFIKVNGVLYYVKDTNGTFEAVKNGKYTVSADDSDAINTADTTKAYYVKDGKIVKKDFITLDGKEYYIDETCGIFIPTAPGKDAEFKECEVEKSSSSSTTTTKVNRLLSTTDGHVVKGWDNFANDDSQDKWYYTKADGTVVKDEWVCTTPGRWFYITATGNMLTSGNADTAAFDHDDITCAANATANVATVDNKKNTYVVDENGLWLSGWKFNADKTWSYYGTTGNGTGWMKYGTKWVYLDDYVANMNEIGAGATEGYAFDKDCYMITGFGKAGSKTVYADANGKLADGDVTIDGVKYHFNNGVAELTVGDDLSTDATGKVLSNTWVKYEADVDGEPSTPDVEVWSFIKGDGKLEKSAWVKYGNSKCWVDDEGYMVAGQVASINNDGTYADEITNAFIKNGGNYLTGTELSNKLNFTIVIAENGVVVNNGWAVLERNPDGSVKTWGYAKNGQAYNGWLFYNGKWYYIDCGVMLADFITPDGYYVDENGVWVVKTR